MLFRVRLSNATGKLFRLKSYDVRPVLYARFDFGGQTYMTEPFEGAMDPIWRFDSTFEFHASSVEELHALRLQVTVMANSGQGSVLGRYSTTLYRVATQDTTMHIFELERPHGGEMVFSASMEQVSIVTLRMLHVQIDQLPPIVSQDAICPYLSYCVNTHATTPVESKVKLSEPKPHWSDLELPPLHFRTTMSQLLSSRVEVKILHAVSRHTPNIADVVVATSHISLRPLVRCTATHSSLFESPITLEFLAGPFESQLRGTIEFLNLPKVIPEKLIFNGFASSSSLVDVILPPPPPPPVPAASVVKALSPPRSRNVHRETPKELVRQRVGGSGESALHSMTTSTLLRDSILMELKALDEEEQLETKEYDFRRKEFETQEMELKKVLKKLS
eukprot:PhF_6_TR18612/c0_g1_i1/m.27198